MRKMIIPLVVVVLAIGSTVGCTREREAPAAKENVEKALQQANLGHINVDENRDKRVITLKGEVQTEEQKRQAEQLAQQTARGMVIANEIALRPPGMEETAEKVQSATDDAIEDSFKAAIAANKWDNQHIRYEAKNGVLTLRGDVDTADQRAKVEQTAAALPGVKQVVNELEVKGRGKKG